MDTFNTKVFRSGDEEKTPVVKAKKHPDVMTELRPIHPNRESLTPEQTKVAVAELHNKQFTKLEFPKNMKFASDPRVPNQTYGLISFVPSKNAVPDQDGCFGIIKLRGNFSSEQEADIWAEKLIKDHDTYFEIDTVRVGIPFPIFVNNEIYASKTREIDIRKTVTDIQKSAAQEKVAKEQKEIQEIQERQRKLLDKDCEEEKDKSFTDLDYYISIKVKKANALSVIDEAEAKINEARKVVEKVSVEIAEFDEKQPDYQHEYLEKYKHALGAIGVEANENPLIKYMNR